MIISSYWNLYHKNSDEFVNFNIDNDLYSSEKESEDYFMF